MKCEIMYEWTIKGGKNDSGTADLLTNADYRPIVVNYKIWQILIKL